MSWIFGSCPGPTEAWLQLSNAIVAAATGTSVKTAVVNNGGTGGAYLVGEFLTLVGGTFTVAAQVEVLTISGSDVDTVRIHNAGVYTVAPSTTAATTGGSGTGCTIDNTTDTNGWIAHRDTGHELSAIDSVAAPGTGYNIGDVITLAGGTGTAATITVATLTGGAGTGVASATITMVGDYDVIPTDPVAQASTDGGGSGATFNLTFEDGEREVILEGEGSGSDEIFVGWRTYSSPANDRYNLELHGMAGFSASVPVTEQPSVSPGEFDGGTAQLEAGCYLLSTNISCNYWISVLPTRIVIICQVGGNYFNAYLGWGDRYATDSEYPYPLVVAGSSSDADASHAQAIRTSGLIDPWRYNGAVFGPMGIMFVDNAWYAVQNSNISTGNAGSVTNGDRVVVPCGLPDREDVSVDDADRFVNESNGMFSEFIPHAGIITAGASMQRTPGTVESLIVLPATVVFTQPSHQILMELTGVFWVSGFGGIQSGDRTIQSGEVYRIFANCNRSEIHGFLAVKET